VPITILERLDIEASITILTVKLAALEKKFGKKPNIIMVLSDDVGWGVLGSYGGGKVVGTPTPNLDNMAREGMQFLSAYSERFVDLLRYPGTAKP
jgi:hypothetical protein